MNYQEEIQKELARAQTALEAKNEGKVRVCCRRAAGVAIRHWLANQPEPPAWGRSAIVQLKVISGVESLPAPVRNAAARLTTSVAKDHTVPFDESPIDDALIIIKHFGR